MSFPPRRMFTIGIWPMIDVTVTLLANIMLVRFGFWTAIIGTFMVNIMCNIGFLLLLHREQELPQWIEQQLEKIQKSFLINSAMMKKTKAFGVLLAYLISGPAMVGTPLLWLMGIAGREAYLLATVGSALNTGFWVGGVYHLFWELVRSIGAKI